MGWRYRDKGRGRVGASWPKERRVGKNIWKGDLWPLSGFLRNWIFLSTKILKYKIFTKSFHWIFLRFLCSDRNSKRSKSGCFHSLGQLWLCTINPAFDILSSMFYISCFMALCFLIVLVLLLELGVQYYFILTKIFSFNL